MMDSLFRDVKFSGRLLWKDRGFAATAILTLAVCIGANVAIFTIVNSVLLTPLPVPDADRIVLMSNLYPNAGVEDFGSSGVPDYYDRIRDVDVLEEHAVYRVTGETVEIDGTPQRVRQMRATPSLFRLLEVEASLGRTFVEEEGEVGNDHKVLLSYGLWQQLYGGDPSVLDADIRLSGRPFTIVGVMPEDFLFVDPEVLLWTPVAFTDEDKSDNSRHSNNWRNVGRLKPGATIEQAQAQVDALNAANLERFPAFKELLINAGFHTGVEPLQNRLVRDVRSTLYLLWGGAAFVLLIGAVNIANLALARSGLRLKELATRLALGAARAQVTRQLITESVILALAGGVGGLMIGQGMLGAFGRVGLDRLPRAGEIHIDPTVVGLTIATAVLAGILIGLVPVGHIFRIDLNRVLHEESRSGSSGKSARAIRRGLVVAQVGFAFVLLIGAGLLLASFRELLLVDPGFKTDGVLTVSINVPAVRYEGADELRPFMTRTLETIRALPGVEDAGATNGIPLGESFSSNVILAEGYEMQPGESLIAPYNLIVTSGYFEAMRIPLRQGRYFTRQDSNDAPGAVVIDERLANKFWPGRDPIGQRLYSPGDPNDLLKIDENTSFYNVVGVVANVRREDIAGDRNQTGAYYFVYDQTPTRNMTLAIKTSTDPEALLNTVRSEIAGIDPELPLYAIQTMSDRTEQSLMPRKASMLLALSFGSIALFLSAVGIYGVLAYLVTQRTKEIGIRIALGSSARRVFSLVLGEGAVLVGGGLILGLIGMVALRQAVQSQIYGVGPTDPFVVGVVFATLGAVAVTACALPARRATQVDPIVTLNEQ